MNNPFTKEEINEQWTYKSLNLIVIKDCKLKHQWKSFNLILTKNYFKMIISGINQLTVKEKFLYIDMGIHMGINYSNLSVGKFDSM